MYFNSNTKLIERDACVCNLFPSSPPHLQSPFISIPNLLSDCLSLDRRQRPRVSSAAIPQRSRTPLIVMELGDPGGSRWSGTCSTARLPVGRKSPHLHCWRPCLPRLSLLCRWPRRHVILGFHTRGVVTHSLRVTRTGVGCQEYCVWAPRRRAVSREERQWTVAAITSVFHLWSSLSLQAAATFVYRRISMFSFVWFDFALFKKNLF